MSKSGRISREVLSRARVWQNHMRDGAVMLADGGLLWVAPSVRQESWFRDIETEDVSKRTVWRTLDIMERKRMVVKWREGVYRVAQEGEYLEPREDVVVYKDPDEWGEPLPFEGYAQSESSEAGVSVDSLAPTEEEPEWCPAVTDSVPASEDDSSDDFGLL